MHDYMLASCAAHLHSVAANFEPDLLGLFVCNAVSTHTCMTHGGRDMQHVQPAMQSGATPMTHSSLPVELVGFNMQVPG